MRHLSLSSLTGAHFFSRSGGTSAVGPSASSSSRQEGAILGIIVATGIWIWLAVVDAVAGQPFHTFEVLGGVTAFTIVHYLLNIAYGVTIVSALRGTKREPSLAIAVLFGLTMLEVAIAMVTVLLSHLGLGILAWVAIFGGSLVGLLVAVVVLARTHPLVAQVRDADRDTDAD